MTYVDDRFVHRFQVASSVIPNHGAVPPIIGFTVFLLNFTAIGAFDYQLKAG